MSHAELAGHHKILHAIRQVEQPDEIGNVAARLAYNPRKCILAVLKLVDQTTIGLRFLDWIQILPLNIFNQSDFKRLCLVEFADQRRYLMKLSFLCCTPATLTSDNLIAPTPGRTDNDGLNNTTGPNAIREFRQGFLIEMATWLIGMRRDERYFYQLNGTGRIIQ